MVKNIISRRAQIITIIHQKVNTMVTIRLSQKPAALIKKLIKVLDIKISLISLREHLPFQYPKLEVLSILADNPLENTKIN